jgi:S1-C subfamily serine protease
MRPLNKHCRLAMLLLIISAIPTCLWAQSTHPLSQLLPQVLPAVVQIHVTALPRQSLSHHNKTRHRGPELIAGSGVIVNAKKGWIATSAHLFPPHLSIAVILNDGRRFHGKLLGVDPATDIALLAVPAESLTALPLGESQNLQIGDRVIAVGNPFGLAHTVTSGVVSALHRQIGLVHFEDFIQLDAPINPGNSGGALIDDHGRLLGINTAVFRGHMGGNTGIGFATPIALVKPIIEQLAQYGKVQRGQVGIMVQTLTQPLAKLLNSPTYEGAVITEVLPNSAAKHIGLKKHDIIIRVNKTRTRTSNETAALFGVQNRKVPFSIEYIRNNRNKTAQVRLVNPNRKNGIVRPVHYGLVLTPVQFMDNEHILSGLKVNSVHLSGSAALHGLLPGDIILSENQHNLTSLQSWSKYMYGKNKTALLDIYRHKHHVMIALPLLPTPPSNKE